MSKKHIINVCILFVIFASGWNKAFGIQKYAVDIGRNISIPCGLHFPTNDLKGYYNGLEEFSSSDVMWIRKGREEMQIPRLSIQPDGSLFLSEVTKNDSGIYSCSLELDEGDFVKNIVEVIVRTPPPPLANVRVHPSTILALILWEVKDNGGYPIIDFTAQYRLASSNETWKPISPDHMPPNARQIDVYRLVPNTTYAFRVWATNQLGPGEITEVEGKTLNEYQEIELARHLLGGVKDFDTRVWVLAVSIVMGTLVVLSIGTCYLLYIECRSPDVTHDEQEVIELVPNIILNPGFDDDIRRERIPADENCNCETTLRLNNNTVIQPRRL